MPAGRVKSRIRGIIYTLLAIKYGAKNYDTNVLKHQLKSQKPLLIARDISFELRLGKPILSGISVHIDREKVGMVGDNGVGKTTLLRILVGELTATSGVIECSGKIVYLPQRSADSSGNTVREYIVKSPLQAGFEGRFRSYLGRMGLNNLDVNRLMGSLSGGEQMKVKIACLVAQNPQIIILDEPTNNLDLAGIDILFKFVREWQGGLLVVSHDRKLLMLVDRILELTPRGLHEFGGNYEIYTAQKQLQEEALAASLQNACELVSRVTLQKATTLAKQSSKYGSGRSRAYRTGLSKVMRGNAQRHSENSTGRLQEQHDLRVTRAEEKVASIRSQILSKNEIVIDLSATEVPNGKLMVEFIDVDFSYPHNLRKIISTFNWVIYGPQRIAIQGANGSGKTTLIKLLTGELQPTSGVVRLGTSRFAYLDQQTKAISLGASLIDNFKLIHDGYTDVQIRRWFGRFLFTDESVFKLTDVLSGGERMKAALALVLGGDNPPQLLILDEPTNNLDLNSIQQLESALGNYRGALIVISHDESFLKNIGIERSIKL